MISGEVFDATSSAEPAGQTLSPTHRHQHEQLHLSRYVSQGLKKQAKLTVCVRHALMEGLCDAGSLAMAVHSIHMARSLSTLTSTSKMQPETGAKRTCDRSSCPG